jgi:hypothetical protein
LHSLLEEEESYQQPKTIPASNKELDILQLVDSTKRPKKREQKVQ